jgi:hypothetical protein
MSNHTDEGDPFGFTSRNTAKEKLRNIRPTLAPSIPDMARVDAAAENAGFVSRENTPALPASPAYLPPPAPMAQPTIAINMRVPQDVAGAFKRFCTENRYSYPEALEVIMMRAGLPTK